MTEKSWNFLLPAHALTGSLCATAELTGCSHHTAARHVAARDAGRPIAEPAPRPRVTDVYLPKIEEWIEASKGRIRADKAAPPLPAELEALMRQLKMPHARALAPELIANSRAQRWETAEIIKALFAEEAAGRARSMLATRRKAAGFSACPTRFRTWRMTCKAVSRSGHYPAPHGGASA